jgi:pyruvate dehydrogenase E1 component alpha subunit
MNLAAIWKLPVIFLCENNRYAESTPFEYAIAGGSVADRAAGYDMPGILVDGQSVLDMYEVGGQAVDRARRGDGPTLIEAQTYRYFGHFGADNPLGYRSEDEEAHFKARDCIARLKAHVVENDVASEEDLQALDEKGEAAVTAAARFANESPFPELEELFTDVYISYPDQKINAGAAPEMIGTEISIPGAGGRSG